MRKIQKKICQEELKSRIPGLFAYIEENDAGEFKLHKATDSLQGCYGKIIENIKIPENIFLTVEGVDYIKEKEIYSYRTLMEYYYQYKDYDFGDEDDNSFIIFIDNGIGKIDVEFERPDLISDEYDLMPHFIYLANVRKLYEEYQKMDVICDLYDNNESEVEPKVNTVEPDICCLCEKYKRMGGDEMLEFIITLLDRAEAIAEEYFGYAVKGSSIKINVNLTQSINDIGYLSSYINPWVGGNKHTQGELYTYNDETYVCMKDNTDIYDEETMTFVFDTINNFKRLKDLERWPNDEPINTFITSENLYGHKFLPTGSEVNDHLFEEVTDENRIYDINHDGIIDSQDVILANTLAHSKGHSDSKLQSLRRFKTYISGDDRIETPDSNEDWLFYYRKGLVTNYRVISDDLGNIASLSAPYNDNGGFNPANTVNDLMAFGDVITDITVDKDKRIITFDYCINAHLKASEKKEVTDDDGNTIYVFDGFYYDDENDNYGVKYTESYTYDEGGELDKLVNGEIEGLTFENYVSEVDKQYADYNRYEFNIGGSKLYYNKRLESQIVSIPYLKSNFDAKLDEEVDYLYCDVFKDEYLNGITFKPTVETDIDIRRGNFASFERHMKLGEIKSMEALEKYPFFKVVKS